MDAWIRQEIAQCIETYRSAPGISTAWKEPLVAYADAGDPLFLQLKEVVRPSHYTPRELLGSARTVIVYFLPFAESIGRGNRRGEYASPGWSAAYIETNQLIIAINQRLVQALEKQGYEGVVLPPTHNFDEEDLVSDWSHKHVAYIAGLGKFGLHQMLITRQGCCGRLGSLITSAPLDPTPRLTGETCLYKYDQSCRICVTRCASGALTEAGFDRHKCYAILLKNAEHYKDEGLADVCGKCASAIPCSFIDPVARLLEKQGE